jgi:hypothetical protein
MTTETKRTPVLAFFGLLTTIGATFYVIAPSILPESVLTPIQSTLGKLDPTLAVTVLGGAIALYAIWTARKRTVSPPPNVVETPPEEPAAEPVIGRDLDASINDLATDLQARRVTRADTEPVKSELRDVAAGILCQTTQMSSTEAHDAVDGGGWTDNHTAAAFLATTDTEPYSLWQRIRWWILPGAEFERRVTQTIKELERTYRNNAVHYTEETT